VTTLRDARRPDDVGDDKALPRVPLVNKRQIAGIFQSNCDTQAMAVNCDFSFRRMPADGGLKFTREWVTKSA
jgi:hypothetical protein